MKIARQFVSFVLGIAVGVCLYSLFKLRPLLQSGMSGLFPRVGQAKSPRAAEGHRRNVRGAARADSNLPVKVPASVEPGPAERHPQLLSHPLRVRIPEPDVKQEVESVTVAAAAPPPIPLKPVESTDSLAGRPTVTPVGIASGNLESAAPPAVLPAEEPTGAEPASIQPASTAEMAVASPVPAPDKPVVFKPIGYVERAGGEVEAFILQDNEPQAVHTGDLIAGRYRITSITPDAVDAVDETLVKSPMPKPRDPEGEKSLGYVQRADGEVETVVADGQSVRLEPEPATVTMAKNEPTPEDPLVAAPSPSHVAEATVRPSRSAAPTVLSKAAERHQSAHLQASDTFIFQALGYVETRDKGFQAVVANGMDVYLVKKGDTFAGQYEATSVDPSIVLAVRVPPGQEAGNSLSAQTDSGGKFASNQLYGLLHFSLSGLASGPSAYEVDALASPVLMDPGVNLLDSTLAGFNLQAHFFSADHPNTSF